MSSYNNVWLYAYSSKNKIKMWKAFLQPIQNFSHINIIIAWGYKDQAFQQKIKTITKGKNIGKSNETSIQEQAELELKYLYTKQFDSGYKLNIEDYVQPISCMLAHKYKDRKHTISWPQENETRLDSLLYVSPKLNGIRLNIFIDENGNIEKYQSRSGKLFKNLHHIGNELASSTLKNIVLDGELYTHNIPFEVIASLINSDEYTEIEFESTLYKTEDIKFYLYDIISLENRDLKFYERYQYILNHIPSTSNINILENYIIHNEDQLKQKFNIFMEQGYEGLMLRTPNGVYECGKRSNHLLKYKIMEQDEFLIHSIYIAENDPLKVQIICVNKFVTDETSPHRYFNISSLKGNKNTNYDKYFKNKDKLENKAHLTVDYQALSEYNVPLFAVGVDLREGKLDENKNFIPSI